MSLDADRPIQREVDDRFHRYPFAMQIARLEFSLFVNRILYAGASSVGRLDRAVRAELERRLLDRLGE